VTHYYVYYKVDEPGSLRPRVERLFERIKAQTSIQGRWLRRRDDPATYMEVYEGVSDEKAFEAALERESAGFGPARRTETFIDVPDRPGVAR
jgi:hypothetical protein